jgi:acetoin utilization deacetylase AcuC-like enzyme
VLTVSIHAHPKRFYPFFWGYEYETGRGAGEGFNLNIPMERGTVIKDYCVSLETALQRVTNFGANALVLAAGLDIAVDDPFKGFAIATPEFEVIGKMIAQLKLPTLVVQEGGYPSPSLGLNLASLLKGLGT